ncbi:MAG TPA: hypothetical protein VD788_03590 [Candidatus Polarisedimenticolaceae bacterium]|nr:hypothetical protein [Candidatus Polarisedimenticolaceae bacterium]
MWSSRRLASVGLAVWLGGGAAALAGGFAGVDSGVETTDNVTRAVFAADRETETFGFVEPSAGWRLQPSTAHSLFLGARLRLAVAARADGLTHYAPEAAVRWQGKTRLGADAPRWIARLRAEWLGFRSDVRRGWHYEASIGYAAPAGRRFWVSAEANALTRDADSAAFSQDALGLELRAEWRASRRWRVYAVYGARDGDVTSTATPAAIDPRVGPILASSTARVEDDAFPGKVAYRLDGLSQRLELGANGALTRNGAFDLRYRFESTDAGAGIDYHASLVRAAWLLRF